MSGKAGVKLRFILISMYVVLFTLTGYTQVSPFNGKAVNEYDSAGFTFLVTGHIHGASSNVSGFPASTILGNIDSLNSFKPSFMVSLGDLFPELNPQVKENYDKSFFEKISFPLFNVVGNHDLGRGAYVKWYGKTYSHFIFKNSLFVFLDTESDDGSIEDEQLGMLREALEQVSTSGVKHVFVFSHRPVWAEQNKRYDGLFAGNTRTMVGNNNYERVVLPLLKDVSKLAEVYWMSGSMSSAPVSFFYDKDPGTGIVHIQTAIRELPRDAVLKVNMKNDRISFECISLTGQDLKSLESYDINFWKSTIHEEPEFNFRLLPYLTLLMITHNYFWFGFGIACITLLVLFFIVLKLKRGKR